MVQELDVNNAVIRSYAWDSTGRQLYVKTGTNASSTTLPRPTASSFWVGNSDSDAALVWTFDWSGFDGSKGGLLRSS